MKLDTMCGKDAFLNLMDDAEHIGRRRIVHVDDKACMLRRNLSPADAQALRPVWSMSVPAK